MAKDKKKNISEKKSEEKVEEVQVKDNIDYSELKEKLKEAENQVLLSLADNDNLRKRFDREKEDLNQAISNMGMGMHTTVYMHDTCRGIDWAWTWTHGHALSRAAPIRITQWRLMDGGAGLRASKPWDGGGVQHVLSTTHDATTSAHSFTIHHDSRSCSSRKRASSGLARSGSARHS